MTKESSIPAGQRVGTAVAAISGLIVAACISALPSATCTATIQAYERAILDFGGVAITGLYAFILIEWGHRATARRFSGFAAAVLAIAFTLTVSTSIYNLRASVDHCLTDKVSRIPMARTMAFWELWTLPPHHWD